MTICIVMASSLNAQSLKDLFSKDNIANTIEKVVDKATGSNLDITGTWTYEQCKIQFESDNFLKKAGGTLAASKLEDELGKLFEKIGIKSGCVTYTFNADSTFTSTASKINSRGTYSINSETSEMTLKMLGGVMKSNCTVEKSGSTLCMLYDADKLLSIVTTITQVTDSKLLDSISSLLGSYDGCKIGMQLTKTE